MITQEQYSRVEAALDKAVRERDEARQEADKLRGALETIAKYGPGGHWTTAQAMAVLGLAD